jgi:hypothetical protein
VKQGLKDFQYLKHQAELLLHSLSRQLSACRETKTRDK